MDNIFGGKSSEDFTLRHQEQSKKIEKESLSFDGEFAWGYQYEVFPKTDSGFFRAIEGGFEFIGERVNVTITSERKQDE